MKIKILGLIVGWILSANALAEQEVTCRESSCLTAGWDIRDSRRMGQVECREQDCGRYGWAHFQEGRFQSETRCWGGQCFTQGFDIFDTYGRLRAQARCHAPSPYEPGDCWRYGWTRFENGRAVMRLDCYQQDCHLWGWEVTGYGLHQRAWCKAGGCLVDGWTLSP